MNNYYVITGECSGSDSVIYIRCQDSEIDLIAKNSGVGCSECRIVQKIEKIETGQLDFVMIDGVLFTKAHWYIDN